MASKSRKNSKAKKSDVNLEVDPDVLKRIYLNNDYSNRRMVEEMELSTEHHGLTGGYREGMWLDYFRSIIPLKYQLAQGVIIIDSQGRTSNEVDIAVYDETYTPYVFRYNTLKIIPIEAVVMVIECKSKSYTTSKLQKWSRSIEKLTPTASGIARIVQGYVVGETNRSQTRTRPIRVLVSLRVSAKEKNQLESVKDLGNSFDFIIEEKRVSSSLGPKKPDNRFVLHVPHEDMTLGWWGEVLNQGKSTKDVSEKPLKLEHLDKAYSQEELETKYPELRFNDRLQLVNTLKDLRVKGNALLTLNLQLNQLLILLNNPMLFPHLAYAQAFNKMLIYLEAREGTSETVSDQNQAEPEL
ncbi:DUF6602 domain-containing protein [Paenibacillus spiritus]|uniref:DUF6602 domain-containing protein n=1 Tax=Paenibacillus spiritus TaxID=2496557 RepID=UPI00168B64CE|nr:DUF6602 domain-containing protein [Paenibacillus spiritus]